MKKILKKILNCSLRLMLVVFMIVASTFGHANYANAQTVNINETITSVTIDNNSTDKIEGIEKGTFYDVELKLKGDFTLKGGEFNISLPKGLEAKEMGESDINSVINNKNVKVGTFNVEKDAVNINLNDLTYQYSTATHYGVDLSIVMKVKFDGNTTKYVFNNKIIKEVTYKTSKKITARKSSIAPYSNNETTDLNQMVTGVEISGLTQGDDGKYVAKAGQEYNFKIQFKETETLQFANGSTLIYTLPTDLTNVNLLTNGEFIVKITAEDGQVHEVNGNTYRIEEGQIIVNFNAQDPNYEKLTAAGNVGFQIELKAEFDSSKDNIKIPFGNDITKEVTIEQPVNNVTVNKWGNIENGVLKYGFEVKSTGDNKDIKVEDFLSSTEFIKINKDVTVRTNKNYGDKPTDLEPIKNNIVYKEDGSGFTTTIPQMQDGEIIIFEYTAEIDYSKFKPDQSIETIIGENGKNTVKLNGSDEEDKNSTKDVTNQISYQWITKSSGEEVESPEAGKKIIPWTLKVNEAAKASVAGSKISDEIDVNSREIMSYTGDGIVIVVKDVNG